MESEELLPGRSMPASQCQPTVVSVAGTKLSNKMNIGRNHVRGDDNKDEDTIGGIVCGDSNVQKTFDTLSVDKICIPLQVVAFYFQYHNFFVYFLFVY